MSDPIQLPATFLSLGAGVQSSTIALMIEAGELPMVDAAIFADTGAEPDGVYRWLDYLETLVSFPIHRVTRWPDRELEDAEGILRTSKKGVKYVSGAVPLWVHREGKAGGGLMRKCTRDFKISVINREVRRLTGTTGKALGDTVIANQWIGISTDEAHRMKPSRLPWSVNHYPLIEKDMSRTDCLEWVARHGFPEPPRSSCVFCPYHSADEWLRLQTKDPTGYDRAVSYEQKMREQYRSDETLDGDDVFVQKIVPGIPLGEINWTDRMEELREEAAKGQLDIFWGNECDGICGV